MVDSCRRFVSHAGHSANVWSFVSTKQDKCAMPPSALVWLCGTDTSGHYNVPKGSARTGRKKNHIGGRFTPGGAAEPLPRFTTLSLCRKAVESIDGVAPHAYDRGGLCYWYISARTWAVKSQRSVPVNTQAASKETARYHPQGHEALRFIQRSQVRLRESTGLHYSSVQHYQKQHAGVQSLTGCARTTEIRQKS